LGERSGVFLFIKQYLRKNETIFSRLWFNLQETGDRCGRIQTVVRLRIGADQALMRLEKGWLYLDSFPTVLNGCFKMLREQLGFTGIEGRARGMDVRGRRRAVQGTRDKKNDKTCVQRFTPF
jgi:hypothetical protein